MPKKRNYSKSFNSEPKQLPSGRWRLQLYLGKDDNGKKVVKSFTADKPWEAVQQAEEYLECLGDGSARCSWQVCNGTERLVI